MSRKKILLLADDLRMHSGVARMCREIVVGTLHKYDWVQIAGAVKHPEEGKRIVVQSDDNFKLPEGSSCVLYPVTGYGNPDLLRQLINVEKPDAIMHFTDPRFWVWLYQMEHEVRQNIPIMYYNIWDDLPDPMYNRNFYRSSDLLVGISKQTYGINKRVVPEYEDWQIEYIPHGINNKFLYKVKDNDLNYKRFLNDYGFDKYKFRILFCNRNIRRKQPGDVALAYKYFMDKLTPKQRKECCLIFHSSPVDENGTDMRALHASLLPEYPIIFTYDKGGPMDDKKMNLLYNAANVYINLASNEGFGLGSAESLMTETPIIVNVTGGLQDQCGFKNEKGEYLTADDYIKLGTNHRGEYKEHGEWVKPVFPSNISLQGSPQTPYIFDDRCSSDDASVALLEWYEAGQEERERCGKLGYEYVNDKNIGMHSEEMCNRFLSVFDTTFKKWKPREKFVMEVI